MDYHHFPALSATLPRTQGVWGERQKAATRDLFREDLAKRVIFWLIAMMTLRKDDREAREPPRPDLSEDQKEVLRSRRDLPLVLLLSIPEAERKNLFLQLVKAGINRMLFPERCPDCVCDEGLWERCLVCANHRRMLGCFHNNQEFQQQLENYWVSFQQAGLKSCDDVCVWQTDNSLRDLFLGLVTCALGKVNNLPLRVSHERENVRPVV